VLAWAFATVMGSALLTSAATAVGSGAAANPGSAGAERQVAAVKAEARNALDNVRRIAMQLSFWLFAEMFLGAFAAGVLRPPKAAQRATAANLSIFARQASPQRHPGDCHGPFHPALVARRSHPHHHPAGAILALRAAGSRTAAGTRGSIEPLVRIISTCG
jgi:hypothetical protein